MIFNLRAVTFSELQFFLEFGSVFLPCISRLRGLGGIWPSLYMHAGMSFELPLQNVFSDRKKREWPPKTIFPF